MRSPGVLSGTHGCSDTSWEKSRWYYGWKPAGPVLYGAVPALDQRYSKSFIN